MPARVLQSVGAAVVLALLLVSVGLAAEYSEKIADVSTLTRDPTAVAGVPWWTGSISRLTNLCWAAAASLNALATHAASPPHRRPLVLLSALCAVLAVDDTMLVHDSIMPGHGVPEQFVLVAYAVAGMVLAWMWLRTPWRRTVVVAFFTGAAFLALSVVADVVHSLPFLLEDGAKLVGIIAWCFCGAWAHADMLAIRRGATPEGAAQGSRGSQPAGR
jgi:hypothetical protein